MFVKTDLEQESRTPKRNHRCDVAVEEHRCECEIWNSEIGIIEDHFLSILQHAKKRVVPVDLHYCRNDRDRVLQLYTGRLPVNSLDVKQLASGLPRIRFFPRGSALVLTLLQDGTVSILLYRPTYEQLEQKTNGIVWGKFDGLAKVTIKVLVTATRDFFSLCCDRFYVFECSKRNAKFLHKPRVASS